MYETFFELKKRPFLAIPTLDRYFPTEAMEQAFRSVTRAIERGEGPVAVMGPTGVGKSLFCLRVADSWRRNFEIILLSSSKFCTRRALLQNLLFELRMPYRDLTEGELRLSLIDRLQPSLENNSEGLLLIVDEAQTLSVKLLEELRMLTNLACEGVPRVRLVLVGNLRLDELLGHPRLESLYQRLACRCYLRPLSMEESCRYMKHKIELCGVRYDSVITEEACRAAQRATDGVPRLIDQLLDGSLDLAARLGQKPCSATTVERAWAELQQLPSPWLDSANPAAPSPSIEYGSLDEEDEDFEQAEAMMSPFQNASEILEMEPEPQMAIERLSPIASAYEEESFLMPNFVTTPLETISCGLSFDCTDSNEQWEINSLNMQAGNEMNELTFASDPFGEGFTEEVAIPRLPQTAIPLQASSPWNEEAIDQSENPLAFPVEYMTNETKSTEEKVQDQLHEMITSLNMGSSKIEFDDSLEVRLQEPATTYEPNERDYPHDQPFVAYSMFGRGNQDRTEMGEPLQGDDRDLLVVEEDMDVHASLTDKPFALGTQATTASPQSYVQLFSKLRG